jgi:outer membrane protein TolC
MRSRLGSTLVLTALVTGVPVIPCLAQQEGEIETPIRLSLSDVVKRALEENLDIRAASLEPASAAEDVTIADSTFDPDFAVNLTNTESRDEPTSAFSPTSQSFRSLRAEWNDPSRSGGGFTAALEQSETISDFPPGAEEAFALVPKNIVTAFSVGYSQPLLRNFGLSVNRTQVEQATNNLRISEAQLREAVNELVDNAESSYWELVGARRQFEVSRESLRLAQDFLEQTRIKVDVGTLPPIEITTAEAEVASREEGVIVAENGVRSAEDTLRALLRFEEDSLDWLREIEPVDEPRFEETEIDLQEAIVRADARRATVIEARLALQNAELAERFQRDQMRPDLTLNGNFRVSGNSFEYVPALFFSENTLLFDDIDGDGELEFLYDRGDEAIVEQTIGVTVEREEKGRGGSIVELFDSDNTDLTLSLNLNIPVRNRRAKAEHARSRIAVEQARLRVESARQAVRVEVREAVRAVETAARRVQSARVNVSLQRRKLDAEEKRYENGLSTAFQVLEFQQDVQEAESREIDAVIDYNQALSGLARVQGILFEERRAPFS